eukprot:TRINITY_DN5059_c0_g2_i5.p1 TRINITY_DN5059_c0_g2~~TRINITY_DN5059_c0_g2_i5.p1  ORF type:complete len:419 (-),score=146.22 TRINITY_DN5059_c0_g2_i5:95-1351(-)
MTSSNIDLTHNQLDVVTGHTRAGTAEVCEQSVCEDPMEELLDNPPTAQQAEAALAVLEVFACIPDLRTLYLKHNPIISKMERYRKNTVGKLKQLLYLDDRPVDPMERCATDAWVLGGIEAEKAEKLKHILARDQQYVDNFEALALRQQQARERYALEKIEAEALSAATAGDAHECSAPAFPAPSWQLQKDRVCEAQHGEYLDWSGIELQPGQEPPDSGAAPEEPPTACEHPLPHRHEQPDAISELYRFVDEEVEGEDDAFALPDWCDNQKPKSTEAIAASIVASRSTNLADGWACVEKERSAAQRHPEIVQPAPQPAAAVAVCPEPAVPPATEVNYIKLIQQVLAQPKIQQDMAQLTSSFDPSTSAEHTTGDNGSENELQRKPQFVSRRLMELKGDRPKLLGSSEVMEELEEDAWEVA